MAPFECPIDVWPPPPHVGVAAIKQYVVPEPSAAAAPRELEDISLAFQIIEIENKLGGTIASDDRGSGSP